MFSPKVSESSDNISIAFWVKTNENTGKDFIDGEYFRIGTLIGNQIKFAKVTGTTNYSAGSFIAGQWTHVVGTYDGTNIKIYINGILAQSVTNSGSIGEFYQSFVLGYFNSVYWAGSIDDLFIYNRGLTQSEVNQLYNLHK